MASGAGGGWSDLLSYTSINLPASALEKRDEKTRHCPSYSALMIGDKKLYVRAREFVAWARKKALGRGKKPLEEDFFSVGTSSSTFFGYQVDNFGGMRGVKLGPQLNFVKLRQNLFQKVCVKCTECINLHVTR